MTPKEAEQLLVHATDHGGMFTELRVGNDPGQEMMAQLRLALRVLWRHWKSHKAIPFNIAYSAAIILRFKSEAIRNLNESNLTPREKLVSDELEDIAIGAFDLLAGEIAESWIVPRPDLGE